MQIEALKVFCDVISYRSFSEAAEENGVTQSTASQIVQRLEDHLSCQLIDRSYRPWKVTAAGKVCFERCRDIVESFYSLEEEMQQHKKQHKNEIRIASIYSVGFTYMNQVSTLFNERHPNDKLIIRYEHPDEIVKQVMNDDLDLGIVTFPGSSRELNAIPWHDEEMVLVSSPGHPLSTRTDIGLNELDNIQLVTFDRDLKVGRNVAHFLKQHHVKFTAVLRFDNIEAIKRAVEDSQFVAILPLPTIRRELDTGSLCATRFKESNLIRPLGIVTRRGKVLTPATHHLIQMLTEEKDHFLRPDRSESASKV